MVHSLKKIEPSSRGLVKRHSQTYRHATGSPIILRATRQCSLQFSQGRWSSLQPKTTSASGDCSSLGLNKTCFNQLSDQLSRNKAQQAFSVIHYPMVRCSHLQWCQVDVKSFWYMFWAANNGTNSSNFKRSNCRNDMLHDVAMYVTIEQYQSLGGEACRKQLKPTSSSYSTGDRVPPTVLLGLLLNVSNMGCTPCALAPKPAGFCWQVSAPHVFSCHFVTSHWRTFEKKKGIYAGPMRPPCPSEKNTTGTAGFSKPAVYAEKPFQKIEAEGFLQKVDVHRSTW